MNVNDYINTLLSMKNVKRDGDITIKLDPSEFVRDVDMGIVSVVVRKVMHINLIDDARVKVDLPDGRTVFVNIWEYVRHKRDDGNPVCDVYIYIKSGNMFPPVLVRVIAHACRQTNVIGDYIISELNMVKGLNFKSLYVDRLSDNECVYTFMYYKKKMFRNGAGSTRVKIKNSKMVEYESDVPSVEELLKKYQKHQSDMVGEMYSTEVLPITIEGIQIFPNITEYVDVYKLFMSFNTTRCVFNEHDGTIEYVVQKSDWDNKVETVIFTIDKNDIIINMKASSKNPPNNVSINPSNYIGKKVTDRFALVYKSKMDNISFNDGKLVIERVVPDYSIDNF